MLPSSVDSGPSWLVPHRLERTSKLHEHNGEKDLANLLETRGYYWLYEPFWYPILKDNGRVRWFRPDFWVAESDDFPEMHIELTLTGQAIPEGDQTRLYRALSSKRQGVHYLRRYYGIRTILIHYHQWQRILADERHFDRIVRRQLKASHRARRVPWSRYGAIPWEATLPEGNVTLQQPHIFVPAQAV